MNSDIMVANTKQVVILKKDSEIAHFLGFIKANINMSPKTKFIAKRLLEVLYRTWRYNYTKLFMNKDDETLYRYLSLKVMKRLAEKYFIKKGINPNKVKMSITAVCSFPNQNKVLWINTGKDMIYVYRGGNKLFRICNEHKALKTLKDQSVFNFEENYYSLIEGGIEDKAKIVYVVSYDTIKYFEDVIPTRKGFSQQELTVFAQDKEKPIIIGKVFN